MSDPKSGPTAKPRAPIPMMMAVFLSERKTDELIIIITGHIGPAATPIKPTAMILAICPGANKITIVATDSKTDDTRMVGQSVSREGSSTMMRRLDVTPAQKAASASAASFVVK